MLQPKNNLIILIQVSDSWRPSSLSALGQGLHLYARLSAAYGRRFLEDGLAGKLQGHRHDDQGN